MALSIAGPTPSVEGNTGIRPRADAERSFSSSAPRQIPQTSLNMPKFRSHRNAAAYFMNENPSSVILPSTVLPPW